MYKPEETHDMVAWQWRKKVGWKRGVEWANKFLEKEKPPPEIDPGDYREKMSLPPEYRELVYDWIEGLILAPDQVRVGRRLREIAYTKGKNASRDDAAFWLGVEQTADLIIKDGIPNPFALRKYLSQRRRELRKEYDDKHGLAESDPCRAEREIQEASSIPDLIRALCEAAPQSR